MEELTQYVETVLEDLGTWSVPGYAFPAIIIIGLFYLFVGARVCKGVIAGISFLAGGAAGYYFSDNVLIAVASGVGAAVIALVLQCVVVVVLAGAAVGGTSVLVAFLISQEELAPFFAIGGFLVGAILAVKLYKVLLIFATSALGAVCVAPCALILLDDSQRPEMTQFVTLSTIELDQVRFSVVFLGLLAVGVLVQGIALIYKKTAGEAAQ
jgi:hypothetical protein